MARLLTLLPVLSSWALLSYGASMLGGAAVGLLTLGGCIWVDMYLGDRLRGDA